jgi:hypothetical protein
MEAILLDHDMMPTKSVYYNFFYVYELRHGSNHDMPSHVIPQKEKKKMFTEGIGLIMEKAAAPLFSFPFIV